MRILCVSAQKPDSTGSGVYLAETVGAFLQAGHDVAVIAGIDASDAPELPEGARFRPVRFSTPDLPFPVCGMSDVMPYEATRYRDLTPQQVCQFSAAFAEAVRTVAADFQPQLVVCHHLYLVCAVAVETLHAMMDEGTLASPCPVWSVCHSTDMRQMHSHGLERGRIIAGVRALDGVFALHDGQAQEICDLYGLPSGRVRVVGTGYNASVFNPDSSLRKPGRTDVVYVGKIWQKKGVMSLIRCLDDLPFGADEFTLRLVGGYSSQEEYDRARTLAQSCRLPVEFLGRVGQDDLVRAYRSAHVFVLPSFYEGLPLVAVEALACGCHVVMTDLPGIRPWLKSSIPGAPVTYVRPPRMEGDDTPLAQDLPAFENQLAHALQQAAKAAAAQQASGEPSFDPSALSWNALVARMLAECGA